ncbi:hypothetical protein [Streptomyces sp. NBC_01538]|uniref:zinc finger domain-containing protein n=1 Tax=Streptomyces sp. NBC_01538 TaxID=2903897 RepID=UPI00386D4A76
MTRAVAPAVREKARSRTCPDCRAAPGEKCAPDRAGRSQLHRGRIQDAEQAMQVPVYRILPPDADRHFMPLDPDCADTLVVSLHKDVIAELARSHYEAAALLWLVLEQAGQERATVLDVKNFQVAFFLMPLDYLAPGEVLEAVDRLAARGFVERVGDRGVRVNSLAACVMERRELPARFLIEWNAAKASWEGAPMPGPPAAVPATSQS